MKVGQELVYYGEPMTGENEKIRDARPVLPISFQDCQYSSGRSRRNGPKVQRSHSFYTRDWTKFADAFQTTYLPGPPIPPPSLLPKLISAAELIACDLGAFLRLDFYLTSNGPIFGEITWNPFNGEGFTHFGARYMCHLMDSFPDKIRADLSSG